MGDWGPNSWDNDCAADWYAVELSNLHKTVDRMLTSEISVEENFEKIRASISILLFLGRVYMWSLDLETTLKSAIAKLEAMLLLEEMEELPSYKEIIQYEINILKKRLDPNFALDEKTINWWVSLLG
jgi:hypothetical protein